MSTKAKTKRAPAKRETYAAALALTIGQTVTVTGPGFALTGTVRGFDSSIVRIIGKRGAENLLVLNDRELAVTALVGARARPVRVSAITVH
jgi:hypothetical protein